MLSTFSILSGDCKLRKVLLYIRLSLYNPSFQRLPSFFVHWRQTSKIQMTPIYGRCSIVSLDEIIFWLASWLIWSHCCKLIFYLSVYYKSGAPFNIVPVTKDITCNVIKCLCWVLFSILNGDCELRKVPCTFVFHWLEELTIIVT